MVNFKLFWIRFFISYLIYIILLNVQSYFDNNHNWGWIMFYMFPVFIFLTTAFHYIHVIIPKYVNISLILILVTCFFYHLYVRQEEIYTVPIISQLLIPKKLRREKSW